MNQPVSNIRRVVTGHCENGKSVIVSDSVVEGMSLGGGKNFIKLWGNDTTPIHPDNGISNENMDWFPKAGGHRCFVWVVPPKSQISEKPKSKDEIDVILPGFTKHFELNNPGMHTTDSVDCTYLISGSITLEVDDNKRVELKAGDTIIQNGTRHKWENLGEIPAVLISTCIGSERINK